MSHSDITLSSDNNNLGSEGAKSIKKLIEENRSIKSLSLRNNNFTDGDGEAFYNGIKASLSLEFLDLSENKFCETEWLGKLIGMVSKVFFLVELT